MDVRTALRSVSFGCDSKPAMMKTFGSGKMVFDGSHSFKVQDLETMISFKSPSSDKENKLLVSPTSFKSEDSSNKLPISNSSDKNTSMLGLSIHKNQAAVKLQKVYKSFRTRRQLADCAVLVEQRWWKLLDFAELKRSSISFFDIEKPESVLSRWARARTRAAKVGKGLSKDEKARKLALQHWLEAIDPRHRYGHNLQFYYVKWLHCESKQPFFYWLDIGEGKEVNFDRCPRSRLQQQCIKYLGPVERKTYEVVVEEGKFIEKRSGKLLDTTGGPVDAKWIFVLSTSKTLYVGQKIKGTFQHSSFLAGGATLAAGRLVVENGILKAVWPHSGHYLPTEENFQAFMSFLKDHHVDLTDVKESPTDGEEEHTIKGNHCQSMSRLSRGLRSKITKLEIPTRDDLIDDMKMEALLPGASCGTKLPDSPTEDDYESAEESFLSEKDFMVSKLNLFGEDQEEEEDEEPISKERIMRRIDSHKAMNSYQLAQQLSSRWTTGAGPRIGCMRDYPYQLQFRVLEHANLSPRGRIIQGSPQTLSRFSPRELVPPSVCRETTADKSPLALEQVKESQTAMP